MRNLGAIDRSAAARFWAKVDVRGANDCWPFVGQSHESRGQRRGRFWLNGRQVYAHRVAAAIVHGEQPASMVTRHTCDNPICCNPRHLLFGTQAQNARDAVERSRHFLASRTHCKRGHPLSGDNLYRVKGGRACQTCQRQREREYKQRKRFMAAHPEADRVTAEKMLAWGEGE